MYRLHRIALCLVLLMICQSAQSQSIVEYVLDNGSLDDGTSANIDFEHKTMLVSGERFNLKDCARSDNKICINSDYMVFSLPREPKNAKSWKEGDVFFSKLKECQLKVQAEAISVRVYESTQKNGAFHFFVTPSNQLLGWQHKYKTMDGEYEVYRYLMNMPHKIKKVNRN